MATKRLAKGSGCKISGNRYQILSDYEESFPSLSRVKPKVSKKQIELNTPKPQTIGAKVFSEEEDGRCERWAVRALTKAKEGRSPMNDEELRTVIDWLAYRRGVDMDEVTDWINTPSTIRGDSGAYDFDEQRYFISYVALDLESEVSEAIPDYVSGEIPEGGGEDVVEGRTEEAKSSSGEEEDSEYVVSSNVGPISLGRNEVGIASLASRAIDGISNGEIEVVPTDRGDESSTVVSSSLEGTVRESPPKVSSGFEGALGDPQGTSATVPKSGATDSDSINLVDLNGIAVDCMVVDYGDGLEVKQSVVMGKQGTLAHQLFDERPVPKSGGILAQDSDGVLKGCSNSVVKAQDAVIPHAYQVMPIGLDVGDVELGDLPSGSGPKVTKLEGLDDAHNGGDISPKQVLVGHKTALGPVTDNEKCPEDSNKESGSGLNANGVATKPNISWAQMVKGGDHVPKRRLTSKLEFFAPKNPEVIEIESSLTDDTSWATCLLGYFVDASLDLDLVRAIARTLWGKVGLVDVCGADRGFFVFKFNCLESLDYILERGPWHFYGKLLILRRWKKRLRLSKEAISKIPIWIKFHDLPLEFWNNQCLSRIASSVGIPLFLDKATELKQRISYARVCVEIEATKVLPTSVLVKCEGDVLDIKIEYQGVPPVCSLCSSFGHETSRCSMEGVDWSRQGEGKDYGKAKMRSAGETDSETCKRHEDESGSSDSSEWIRVRKRRNGNKGKRQGPSLDTRVSRNVVKENKPQAPGASLPSDQSYRSARLQCNRAPVQAGFSRPAPADLAYCNVTPPSQASQASLLSKAVEGSGKLGIMSR